MIEEIWKPVPDFEGFYEVSNLGRIRSLPRRVRTYSGTRSFAGCVLTAVDDGKGYPKVMLRVDGKHRTFKVHRLVCRAFHGEPPDGQEAHHIDNNPWNSRADNLAWVTASENNLAKNGSQSGEGHPRVRLSDKQIGEIRELADMGFSHRRIGREYGVSYSYVGRLTRGERRAA